MSRTAHLRIARKVHKYDALANKAEAICADVVEQDYSDAVWMPIHEGSREQLMRGTPRFKVIRSLALPILELERPEPPYRRAFNHAAMRFDDGSKTKDAQVSDKIAERWADQFPGEDPTNLTVESRGLRTDITEEGYKISALIEHGEMFQIDFEAVKAFMAYMGRMKMYREQRIDFAPGTKGPFVPMIPLVKFSPDVSYDEVGEVYERLAPEMPVLFQVGELMPPKVY